MGVGFKAKARVSAYFTKLGWRCGCIFVGGVCVRGWVYMFMWLGCVRRVGKYWEGGRRETTPLCHIIIVTLNLLVHEKILFQQPDKDD